MLWRSLVPIHHLDSIERKSGLHCSQMTPIQILGTIGRAAKNVCALPQQSFDKSNTSINAWFPIHCMQIIHWKRFNFNWFAQLFLSFQILNFEKSVGQEASSQKSHLVLYFWKEIPIFWSLYTLNSRHTCELLVSAEIHSTVRSPFFNLFAIKQTSALGEWSKWNF